jgi:tetratricopeptide (TPR) repeat protein
MALLVCGALGQQDERESERRFRFLLQRSEEAAAGMSGAQLQRVENGFKRFLNEHPKHTRAMVAYGVFLYERGRMEEALRWWQKAIATDPREAYAYNELANHYGHTGRVQDALRYYEKAMGLEPTEPVFRFNWATQCVMYRKDSAALYGWDADEIFRRCLEQFRNARDLAPEDFSFSSAYAETFYLAKNADWQQARDAWEFCLRQPLDEAQRQYVYGHLVRVCVRLDRRDEARQWLEKVTGEQTRRLLERKLIAPAIVDAGMPNTTAQQPSSPQPAP